MTDYPVFFQGAHTYQLEAAKFAYERQFCALFMDMGMGKTVTTLTLIDHLIYNELEVRKVLIIAPLKVAKLTWTDELDKWPHLSRLKAVRVIGTEKARLQALDTLADIYIMNRENLPWLVAHYQGGIKPHSKKSNWPFDMVVLDELSSYKNHQSLRFQMFRYIRAQCSRVIGLTGTPAPNGLIDLWAQMFCVDLGKALGKSISRYRADHFNQGRNSGRIVYNWILKEGHDAKIAELLKTSCLTLRAKDHLNTPEFTRNIIYVEMPFQVLKRYKDFERDSILQLKESGEEVTALTAASLRGKLLQFANGAIYKEGSECLDEGVRDFEEIHDAKLEALDDIIEEAQGRPVFVAWSYRHDRARLMKRYRRLGAKEFTGKNDEDIVRAWNAGEIPILFAHPASVAYGLNLQDGGSIIVWFGMTDSLELYQQFNARLERQGQKNAGFIHHIITKDTEDETMVSRMDGKTGAQDDFLARLRLKMEMYS